MPTSQEEVLSMPTTCRAQPVGNELGKNYAHDLSKYPEAVAICPSLIWAEHARAKAVGKKAHKSQQSQGSVCHGTCYTPSLQKTATQTS